MKKAIACLLMLTLLLCACTPAAKQTEAAEQPAMAAAAETPTEEPAAEPASEPELVEPQPDYSERWLERPLPDRFDLRSVDTEGDGVGTLLFTDTVKAVDPASVIALLPTVVYTGEAITVPVHVTTADQLVLTEGVHYATSCSNNVNCGVARGAVTPGRKPDPKKRTFSDNTLKRNEHGCGFFGREGPRARSAPVCRFPHAGYTD